MFQSCAQLGIRKSLSTAHNWLRSPKVWVTRKRPRGGKSQDPETDPQLSCRRVGLGLSRLARGLRGVLELLQFPLGWKSVANSCGIRTTSQIARRHAKS